MATHHDEIPADIARVESPVAIDGHFVPVRASDLVRAMAGDVERFGTEAGRLAEIGGLIERIIGQETQAFEAGLADRYAMVNPDRECVRVEGDGEAVAASDEVERAVAHVLGKANFRRLEDVEVSRTLATAQTYGLRIRIRPEAVDALSLWIRGRARTERSRRTWRHPLRGERFEVEVYRRLVVVVRLAGETEVRIKHFREIPVTDVEALLPHAEVQMNLMDKLKVIGGSAGAVGATAFKLAKLLATVAVLSQVLWLLAVGCVILVVRGLLGYRSARHMRLSQRTQHLYYQNLANNEAALHTLIALIAYEELKEAILAYGFLALGREGPSGRDELRGVVETYVRDRFGVEAAFDVDDAIETLERLDAWEDRAGFRVRGVEAFLERLREHAREGRTAWYHDGLLSRGP